MEIKNQRKIRNTKRIKRTKRIEGIIKNIKVAKKAVRRTQKMIDTRTDTGLVEARVNTTVIVEVQVIHTHHIVEVGV